MSKSGKPRLALVVSHPIQHFVPFYRYIAAAGDVELTVLFCSDIGVRPYHDDEMGVTIAWRMPLTEGYPHRFLPEAAQITTTGFRDVDNPSVGPALDAIEPDAVLLYGYSQLTQLRALRWCRRKRVPALMISDSTLIGRPGGWREVLRDFALRPLLARFAGFLTVGDENERYLAHYGVPRERMHRSPFTIDEATFGDARGQREVLRAKLRSELGISADAFVGLTVGKLSPRKRGLDVAQAFSSLGADLRRKAVSVLCGNGSELATIEAFVAQSGAPVICAGFVNVDALPAYYAAADALIHAAEHDPHPLVCSEAALMGLPMILSDRIGAVGPSDIARPGRNALIYPVKDVAALTGTIKELVADPRRAGVMAAESRTIFGECDVRASYAGLLKAIDSVI